MGEVSPSCIACEMILDMLFNLVWASSLIELCFSCFTVKILKDFHWIAVAGERSRLVPLKQIANSNCFLFFLVIFSRTSISLRK